MIEHSCFTTHFDWFIDINQPCHIRRYEQMTRTINFTILPPPKALRRDIECFRVASHTGSEALKVKVVPNGLPGLVFQLSIDSMAAIESITTRAAQISNIPILFLHGQGSEPSVMHFRAVLDHTSRLQVSCAVYVVWYGCFLAQPRFSIA